MASSSEDEGDLADIVGVVAEPPPKKTRLDYKGWKCPQCPAVFAQKGNLTAHIKRKHSTDPPSFSCTVCGKTFSQKGHLNYHIKMQHSAEPLLSVPCVQCDKTFKNKSSLAQHVAAKHSTESPSFACAECDATFTRNWSLKQHIEVQHGAKPRLFPCPECNAAFKYKSGRTLHIKTQHGAKPPSFPCPECDAVFRHSNAVKNHIKMRHSAKPPSFACLVCNATFTRNSTLTKHAITQHGANPPSFACPECGKTVTEKGNLKKHRALVHDVDVVWHVCDADPNCSFKAKTSTHLAKHIKNVHARVFAQRKQEQEEKVRRALLDGGWEEHRLAEAMPPVGFFRREKRIDFNCAKKAQPGALKTANQYARIDFVLGVPDGYVFLEVDEHQHRFGYDNDSLSCDMKRMASVMESLAVETDYNLPNVYWLRFNPHAHRANGDLVKVPKAERERRLLAWLEAFAFAAPLGIGYAFYDYDDEDGLEVLANPDYDAQYAAVVDNLKALDDVDVDTDSEDQDVCLPCAD